MRSAYIHIPFCMKICTYCDFPKVFYNEDLVDKYLDALKEEITLTYQNDQIKSIYIGGGTPSALNIKQLDKLFSIIKLLNLTDEAEKTIELNIEDINTEKLELFKKHGINRLSIGIQTINEKFFNFLGRGLGKQTVIEKITLAKKYFDNISVDFMYGFSGQLTKDLDQDLAFIKEIDVKHVSIYSLIIEENTKLFIEGTKAIDEDLESDMYYHIIERLSNLGFKHYEISNFAKEGYRSKHNLVYWNNEEYYGFGMGAASYIDNKRTTSTKSINKYLNGQRQYFSEVIDKQIDMQYFMILGLRKTDGISKEEFSSRYKENIYDIFPIKKLITDGLLIENNDNIYVPSNKLYIQNQILKHFVGGLNEE